MKKSNLILFVSTCIIFATLITATQRNLDTPTAATTTPSPASQDPQLISGNPETQGQGQPSGDPRISAEVSNLIPQFKNIDDPNLNRLKYLIGFYPGIIQENLYLTFTKGADPLFDVNKFVNNSTELKKPGEGLGNSCTNDTQGDRRALGCLVKVCDKFNNTDSIKSNVSTLCGDNINLFLKDQAQYTSNLAQFLDSSMKVSSYVLSIFF